MSSATEFMSGFTGSKVVSNTSANTGNWQGFVVNADAVVSAILDENDASLMTSLGLSGVTLYSGIFISVPNGKSISSITLTSGSVVMYNV
jgi:pyridoxal biosynthesis lyase PdxS